MVGMSKTHRRRLRSFSFSPPAPPVQTKLKLSFWPFWFFSPQSIKLSRRRKKNSRKPRLHDHVEGSQFALSIYEAGRETAVYPYCTSIRTVLQRWGDFLLHSFSSFYHWLIANTTGFSWEECFVYNRNVSCVAMPHKSYRSYLHVQSPSPPSPVSHASNMLIHLVPRRTLLVETKEKNNPFFFSCFNTCILHLQSHMRECVYVFTIRDVRSRVVCSSKSCGAIFCPRIQFFNLCYVLENHFRV